MEKNQSKIIVLAAGKGKRMNSELPKVLVPLNGRPMIQYLMDSIMASGVTDRPIVVVSPDNQQIIAEALAGYDCEYAVQSQQLGTGNAVFSARPLVPESAKSVLVLYGDHPFIKAETIRRMANADIEPILTLPVKLEDFSDWRQVFYHWGRFMRDGHGEIEKIVDKIEALDQSVQALSDEELKGKTQEFKNRLAAGETLDDLLPEAFAVCREAAWRTLTIRWGLFFLAMSAISE